MEALEYSFKQHQQPQEDLLQMTVRQVQEAHQEIRDLKGEIAQLK
jgi:hypothetical protein